MLSVSHIHYPALHSAAISVLGTVRGVTYRRVGRKYQLLLHGEVVKSYDIVKDNDVFKHNVRFDRFEHPWFAGSGCGRKSREYAAEKGHLFLCAKQLGSNGYRNFSSYATTDEFIVSYCKLKSSDRMMHEVISPNKVAMLAFDHDQNAGLAGLQGHNRGVMELREVLFDLLGIQDIPKAVVLNSHRNKADGRDYLSTHQRFPDVTVESFNETMKLVMHLLKHTERSYGGLDFGVSTSYQQMRVPGSSKAGSQAPLLPADGAALTPEIINSLLVSSRTSPGRIHITTKQVRDALNHHFGCVDGCCALTQTMAMSTVDDGEASSLTLQIQDLYRKVTGLNADSITYRCGMLWQVPKAEKCIHGETHKSNRMYIIVQNKRVLCQCMGKCKHDEDKGYVTLGYLDNAPSTIVHPWSKTPKSCFNAITTIDILQHLPVAIDLYALAKILACIGDMKDLLAAYAEDKDTAELAWNNAVSELTEADEYATADTAIKTLQQFLTYVPSAIIRQNKRKRKLMTPRGEKRFEFDFDFERFNREHPSPLALNESKAGTKQRVHTRYLDGTKLSLDARCLLLRSEMSTGKTSNVLLRLIAKHKRVLVVTPKRLYAKSIQGVLKNAGYKFAHYKDEGFWRSDSKLAIVELESLYKMYRNGMAEYDLIVLDESETILRQMMCMSTHGPNLRNNWETLEWLLDNSQQCFAADARMSRITMDVVADLFKHPDIHYIHNTYKIPMLVNWYEKSKVMENTLVKAIELDETIYTFCGSRRGAVNIDAMARDKLGDDKCKLYTSNNSGRLQGDLLNVDQIWSPMCSITTSPSITVGTSFDVKDVIKHVFLFLMSLTASPTDAIQAARRIRHPIVNALNVVVSGPRKNVEINRTKINTLVRARPTILLGMEKDRVTKDFAHDQGVADKILAELAFGSTHEVTSLVNNAVNVTLARNLALRNYNEELCRIFLEMGFEINIIRGNPNNEKLVDKTISPEERVFDQHNNALGVLSHYEFNRDELETKEKAEQLTDDEHAVVKLARYLQNFSDDALQENITHQYWKDYRYCIGKDKRLQLLLQSSAALAIDQGDRNRRFAIAHSEGNTVDARHGTVFSAGVPQLATQGVFAFAKPLFDMVAGLGFDFPAGQHTTTSARIKQQSTDIETALRTCRVLLGPSAWTGGDLPSKPTYKQLIGFLTRMLDHLVGGVITKTAVKQQRSAEVIRVKDKRKAGGSTTRKKMQKVTTYELKYEATGKQEFSAVDRVSHLNPLEL